MVLPTALSLRHCGRCSNRNAIDGRQKMVRIHQAVGTGDDAVAVGVGIVGKGDIELLAHADQLRHRVRRGAIHPDLAVPVERHEAEGRIDLVADQRRVQAIALDDRLPVAHRRAAQGIDADLDACAADRLHVEHIGEIGDIGRDVVVAMHAGSFARALVRNALDAIEIGLEIAVGGALDRAGDVGIGRAAIRRVIFEAAIFRWIVRGRDHDAVGEAFGSPFIIGEDRVRDHRRRRVTVLRVDHHLDAIGGEHFQRTGERRLGQRMGVDADEQRPGQGLFAR